MTADTEITDRPQVRAYSRFTGRSDTTTVKVDRADTGLNCALYVHCERTASGAVSSVHISYPGQIGETQFERICIAFNEAIRKALCDATD